MPSALAGLMIVLWTGTLRLAGQSSAHVPELGDALDPNKFPFLQGSLLGRIPEITLAPFQRSGDPALSVYYGIVADGQRLIYAHLPPEDDPVPDVHCTCNADLCGEKAVLPGDRVVPDMDHIVHFCALANDRIMADPPVDGATSPDLHIVADNHTTAAFHLSVPYRAIFFGIIVKSIRTDDRSCLDDHIVADDAVIQNGDIGVNNAIDADTGVMPDKDIWIEIGSAPDGGRIADHFGRRLERAEMPNELKVGFKRLVDDQQGLAWRHFYDFVDNDEGGGAPDTGIVIFGMIDEYEIPMFYFMDLVDAGSLAVFVADQFGAKELSQPLNGYGRWEMHSDEFV